MIRIPRPFRIFVVLAVLFSFVPLAWIAYVRSKPAETRRIHILQDMDNQARFKSQQVNLLFADGRAMRPPVEGTVARGEQRERTAYEFGLDSSGEWVTSVPMQLSMELMERGRERFNIYCSVCHGKSGYGDGIVHRRATALVENATGPVNGTVWVQPKSLHDATVRDQPPGQIFNTVTYGIRNMSGYAAQVPTEDRWLIVAYVKALQRSQNAKISDVPAERQNDLTRATESR